MRYGTAQRQHLKHSQFNSSDEFIQANQTVSKMRISLDYRLIEVNVDVTTESYAAGCNSKKKATRKRSCCKPSIDYA